MKYKKLESLIFYKSDQNYFKEQNWTKLPRLKLYLKVQTVVRIGPNIGTNGLKMPKNKIKPKGSKGQNWTKYSQRMD